MVYLPRRVTSSYMWRSEQRHISIWDPMLPSGGHKTPSLASTYFLRFAVRGRRLAQVSGRGFIHSNMKGYSKLEVHNDCLWYLLKIIRSNTGYLIVQLFEIVYARVRVMVMGSTVIICSIELFDCFAFWFLKRACERAVGTLMRRTDPHRALVSLEQATTSEHCDYRLEG